MANALSLIISATLGRKKMDPTHHLAGSFQRLHHGSPRKISHGTGIINLVNA
jgi:hypothetical protein